MAVARKRVAIAAGVAAAASAFLMTWEGTTLVAKHERIDPPGVITVCNGITNYDQSDLKEGDRFTTEQCAEMLADALPRYEAQLRACITGDQPPKRHVALLSFVYNLGQGTLCRSSVAKFINAGNVRAGCDAMLLYNRANGVVLRGLDRRRRAERELCLRSD